MLVDICCYIHSCIHNAPELSSLEIMEKIANIANPILIVLLGALFVFFQKRSEKRNSENLMKYSEINKIRLTIIQELYNDFVDGSQKFKDFERNRKNRNLYLIPSKGLLADINDPLLKESIASFSSFIKKYDKNRLFFNEKTTKAIDDVLSTVKSKTNILATDIVNGNLPPAYYERFIKIWQDERVIIEKSIEKEFKEVFNIG